MTNKHIELVKKWLDNKDSVSTEELKSISDDAFRSHALAVYDAHAAAKAADIALELAADKANAYAAAHAAAKGDNDVAEFWAEKYEENDNGSF